MDPLTEGPGIHSACWHGTLEVVKLLLDFKADLEAKEPKMETPPLNTAIAAGNAPVCLELLNRHADVHWKHHDGATALHVARHSESVVLRWSERHLIECCGFRKGAA